MLLASVGGSGHAQNADPVLLAKHASVAALDSTYPDVALDTGPDSTTHERPGAWLAAASG